MRFSNSKISLAATFLTIATICIFIIFVIKQSSLVKNLYAQTLHIQNIQLHAHQIDGDINRYEDLLKVIQLTGDKNNKYELDSLAAQIRETAQQLTGLTINNTQQESTIDSLTALVDQFLILHKKQQNPGLSAASPEFVTIIGQIHLHAERLNFSSGQLLTQYLAESNNSSSQFRPFFYLLSILFVLLIIILVQQSITHIKAEKQAEREGKYNEALMEQSGDAIICTDKNLHITRCNQRAEKLFGWSMKEVLHTPITQALRFNAARSQGTVILRQLRERGVWDGDLTIYKKDGSLVTVHITTTILKEGNQPTTGTITVVRNNSEEKSNALVPEAINKQELEKMVEDRTSEIRLILERLVASEKKYKLLFDFSPLPMWMVSIENLQITDVNDAAIKQFGYSRRSFLQLSTIDLISPEEVDIFEKVIQNNTSGYSATGTWKLLTQTGNTIFADVFTYNMLLDGMPMCLILSNNITEKVLAEEKIKQSLDAIRLLTGHLQNVREEERKMIARDIHDEFGQHLTVIKMDIAWLHRKLKDQPEAVTGKLKNLLETVDMTIKFIRRMCSELRPRILDDMGLVPAIEWQAQQFESTTGIAVNLLLPDEHLKLTADSQTALFRIFQEALTNIARHTKVQQATVIIEVADDQVNMQVIDEGGGFDLSAIENRSTLGILGMRERCVMLGGSFNIESNLERGTTVSVAIPMKEKSIDEVLLMSEIRNYYNYPKQVNY